MRRAAILLAALALAACSTAPGTGWSRANDLSVYSAMHVFARAAIDQEAYCFGRDPARIRADWDEDFRARQGAVSAALVQRYGAEALAEARATFAPRVPCGDVADPQWRLRYTRMLRLLEIRLRMAAEGES
ncbi:MAG TPA: hypothetical protein VGO55_14405 [Allosphingosinicella sp.]|jgi:hypothetical protein|nr:hypothetical protein [Allosphingosinicella sp.]